MKISLRLMPLLLLGYALLLSVSASAGTIDLSNNLSQARQINGSVINNDVWVAQEFSTTNSLFVLTDVAAPLYKTNGATGNFALQIYDSLGSGGTPGAFVANVINTDVSILNTSSSLFDTAVNIILSKNTNYFLVAKGVSLAAGAAFRWDFTSSTSGTGHGFLPGSSVSYDAGSSWSDISNVDPQKMRIQAIPEPASLSLFGIGLAALGFGKRRKLRS